MTIELDELQGRIAVAIAACWIKLYEGQDLIFDTVQSLVKDLQEKFTSSNKLWESVDENEIWDLIRARFKVEQYAFGVYRFLNETSQSITQLSDGVRAYLPGVIETIEKDMPKFA